MTSIREIWGLYNSLFRVTRQVANSQLEPLGLGSAEGNVLLHLLVEVPQGRSVSQEQLVEQLDISKGAISRAVDSLAQKDYVVRKRREDDKRAYRLQLTPKAMAIAPELERIYNEVYLRAIEGVEQEEMEQLFALMRRIAKNFSQNTKSSGGEDDA